MNSNFRYRQTDIKRMHVRGTLSSDATQITYTDENNASKTVKITDMFKQFAGQDIGVSIGLKDDEDLSM